MRFTVVSERESCPCRESSTLTCWICCRTAASCVCPRSLVCCSSWITWIKNPDSRLDVWMSDCKRCRWPSEKKQQEGSKDLQSNCTFSFQVSHGHVQAAYDFCLFCSFLFFFFYKQPTFIRSCMMHAPHKLQWKPNLVLITVRKQICVLKKL